MKLSGDNKTFISGQLTFYEGVTALLACNLLVGLPANVYVVWQITCGSGGAVVSELFALNLAILEIIFCFSSLYMIVLFVLRMAVSVGTLVLQCSLQLMFISRPVFQSCICAERYLAVIHPTMFLRFKPLRYRLLCCMVDWVVVLLYSIVPSFKVSPIQSAYLVISKSLFFLLLMLYCGIRVLCALKQPGPSDRGRHRESQNSMKRKAFKVIMITLLFTSSTQLIHLFMLGPTLLYAPRYILLQITLVTVALSIISGSITPLMYLHRAGKLPCIQF